jgi:hypothetical protein
VSAFKPGDRVRPRVGYAKGKPGRGDVVASQPQEKRVCVVHDGATHTTWYRPAELEKIA